MSESLEQSDRLFHALHTIRMDVLSKHRFGGERDSQLAWVLAHFRKEWSSILDHIWRAHVRTFGRVQHRGGVAHRTRQDMLDGKPFPGIADDWTGGIPSARRLESKDSARRSWDANRSASISARGEWNESSRDRRPRSARGAASCARGIPW